MSEENLVITKEIAEVATATVSIKTMVINQKRVTLSLFRQFPERRPNISLSGDTVIIEGDLWGIVRYTWGGDQGLHVVHVYADEIHRHLVEAYSYQNWLSADESYQDSEAMEIINGNIPHRNWEEGKAKKAEARKIHANFRQLETRRFENYRHQVMKLSQLFIAV